MTQNNGHTHYLMNFRATSASYDHQSFHSMISFRSNNSFNNIFPGEYQNNYSHNPNISFIGQGTSHLEQVRYTINNVNLLMKLMADQAIIQAEISSVGTFDGNKNKFEAWITSDENKAQNSGQDIL